MTYGGKLVNVQHL